MRGNVYTKVLRMVSIVIVLNLALGGLMGLMLVSEDATVSADVNLPPPVGGTVTITTPTVIDGSQLDDGTLDADWNLVITGAGSLTLIDTTLVFQSDTTHRFSLTVNGGELNLQNSTITVKTDDLFDNYEWIYWFNYTSPGPTPTTEYRFKRLIPFDITLNVGSRLEMSDGSSLEYEGDLTITQSDVDISDSVITSPSAPYSTHDWGVVVQIINCLSPGVDVVFADTRIEKSPWFQGISWYDEDSAGPAVQMYANHTITNSDVFFINTYFDLDYRNKSNPHLYKVTTDNHFPPDINPNHNALNIYDSTVKFFGLTINMEETGDMIPNDGSTAIEVKDVTSTVALYRWLTVLPVDNKSIPLSGAIVDIDTIYTGDATINGLNNINNNVPVWNYIESKTDCTLEMQGVTVRATTGTSGKAVFGLLSDLLTDTGWPNSDQKDGYNIDADYDLPPLYTSEGLVDFENFPRVFPEDNYVDFVMTPYAFEAPHPELYPEFITAPKTSELEGVQMNFSIRVFNDIITPPGVAVSDVLVQFWDGNPEINGSTLIGERIITSIAQGANATTWMTWDAAPPGSHKIYIAVDRDFTDDFNDNVIPEIYEDNNIIIAPVTVLERPDLAINGSDISFTSGGESVMVVVNGTTLGIIANVHNYGGSDAQNVEVSFYDGTALGPTDYIDSEFIDVPALGQASASVGWAPIVGNHYVWVYVDEPDDFLESDEMNNEAYNTLVVKSRPDLFPDFPPVTPVYEGSEVTISASIINGGGWNVTQQVVVEFYKSVLDDADYLIGTVTIPVDIFGVSIPWNGGSKEASVTWPAAEYPPSSWTFYARVDPDNDIDESNENNNVDSVVYTVNPRPNLVILPEEIIISDPYPMDGASVNINITIRNDGLSDVTTEFTVQIWIDEVGSPGTKLYEFNITNIGAQSLTYADYDWSPATPPGLHDILVFLDSMGVVAETEETEDNQASTPIIIFEVPSDLIVNDTTYGTLIVDGYSSSDGAFTRGGFTLVEESGELIVRDTILKVIGQSQDNEFNIVVKDSGILRIEEGSTVTSEQYNFKIYLYDNAELYIEDSIIDSKVTIIAMDASRIYITDGTIGGNFKADEDALNVYVFAENSSFSNNLLNIGGNTFMEFYNVYIAGEPANENSIPVSDDAIVYLNWFLTIYTVDINDGAIEGADVDYERSPPWSNSSSVQTDANGAAYFWLRGMNITSTMVVKDIGSYKLTSEFTSSYTMLTYYPDNDVTVVMNSPMEKSFYYLTVMPDLDPPLYVIPVDPPFSIGSPANITVWVNNTGSNTAYDIWVTFDDNISAETLFPKSVYRGQLVAGGSWMIEFQWFPMVLGWHNISVVIDPNDLIIEGDESNNIAWKNDIYVTPEKADLQITAGDIWFTYPSGGPTENQTVEIHANINNIGETNAFPAPKLVVEYWLGTPIMETTFLGWGNISGVAAGDSEESSFPWSGTTPPNSYWIWVIVDPGDIVIETDVNNNRAVKNIIIKMYADVQPVGISFEVDDIGVSSVADNKPVTITATVENRGGSDAENVQVQFFDGDPDVGGKIIGTSQTISKIEENKSEEASVVWTSQIAEGLKLEVRSIYVRVTGVTENIVDNNELSADITVTLRPILTVLDIGFSDDSPFEGESIQIFATVQNIGGTDTTQFSIGFYDGDPDIDGEQIGAFQDILSLTIDEIIQVNVTWSDTTKGAHEIQVRADAGEVIDEANEDLNIATELIAVYSGNDIIVNDANTPRQFGFPGAPEPLVLDHRGYTLVEEHGVLTFSYATFSVLGSDYQFNIIVRNNGTLRITDNSVIGTAGNLIKIYLYDDATLIIEDSTISSNIVDIMAFSNSKIYITESEVNSYIKATGSGTNVRVYGLNSSINQAFQNFGGTSEATFTDVYTPSVALSDEAVLYVYKWLKVYVVDGAGGPKEGAEVIVINAVTDEEIPSSPQTTDENGLALFDVRTDIIYPNTAESKSDLNYNIYATYSGNYTGSTSVNFDTYETERLINVVERTITLNDLLPDLTLGQTTGITFWSNGESRTHVGVGEDITIQAEVENVGNTEASNIHVKFYHEISGVLLELGEDTITEVIGDNGGTGFATFSWVPQSYEVGDNEFIHVKIDPENRTFELNEFNNDGFTGVNIVLQPDLSVARIAFDSEKYTGIDNTTEGEMITIMVTISNGKVDEAASGINVSVFDGNPDTDLDGMPDDMDLLIGWRELGTSTLIPGASTIVDISWDTTDETGGHFIYAYVADGTTISGYSITDTIIENNMDSEEFLVLPKPDIYPTILYPRTMNITLLTTSGAELTTEPQVGQTVLLETTVYNSGQVYVPEVNVSFYLGDPNNGGVRIGDPVTLELAPRNYGNASVIWTIPEPDGSKDLYVWVNDDGYVLESDYNNNIESDTITVSYAPISIIFTVTPKTSMETGETIPIRGRVELTTTSQAIPDLAYTIRITNRDTGAQYGDTVTGQTNAIGVIYTDLSAPTDAGSYTLEIEATYGGVAQSLEHQFTVEEPAPELPWMLFLYIALIVAAAIILIGIGLAKFGLGRLVECGECGAFIPEGEKKCPKCGAVFETQTAKCSECGAWIPVDSKSCPDCGAIFAGLDKDKKGYIERMKLRYTEYVDQYRGEASRELGSDMTDEEFGEWWRANPKYIGFEEWLSREEELKKGRTKNCPACNSVNPESAAICYKCGTVFKEEEEEEEYEEPPQEPPAEVPAKQVSAERRVVEKRATAPPTAVPKKVSRPPEVVPKKVVKAPPAVVPKKVVRPPEDGKQTVVQKKVIKRPLEEED